MSDRDSMSSRDSIIKVHRMKLAINFFCMSIGFTSIETIWKCHKGKRSNVLYYNPETINFCSRLSFKCNEARYRV